MALLRPWRSDHLDRALVIDLTHPEKEGICRLYWRRVFFREKQKPGAMPSELRPEVPRKRTMPWAYMTETSYAKAG